MSNDSLINMVGRGLCREWCPEKGEVWSTIWTLSERDYITRIFELHKEEEIRNLPMLDKVGKLQIPIMTQKRFDFLETSEEFPLQDIINKFGVDYFTNSFAYMLSYALYIGNVNQIDLYGVPFANNTEYMFQRPCTEFWIGVAMGLGVKVNIWGLSELLRATKKVLYGYGVEQKNIPMQMDTGIINTIFDGKQSALWGK